jgi:hypothetical protein
MDLTNIYNIFHPADREHTVFLGAHGTSPQKIVFWDIKKVVTNARTLKLSPVFYQITK